MSEETKRNSLEEEIFHELYGHEIVRADVINSDTSRSSKSLFLDEELTNPESILKRLDDTMLNCLYSNLGNLKYSFKLSARDITEALQDKPPSSHHSYEEIVKKQSEINEHPSTPRFNSIWRHYKGGRYVVVGLSTNEANEEHNVLYYPLPVVVGMICPWSRPLKEWNEEVEWEGNRVTRFTKIR